MKGIGQRSKRNLVRSHAPFKVQERVELLPAQVLRRIAKSCLIGQRDPLRINRLGHRLQSGGVLEASVVSDLLEALEGMQSFFGAAADVGLGLQAAHGQHIFKQVRGQGLLEVVERKSYWSQGICDLSCAPRAACFP